MTLRRMLLVAAVVLVGGALAFRASAGRAEPEPFSMAEQARLRSLDIRFFEDRVRRDPWGAADYAQLAALYLQRARESGEYEDFRRSKRAARASLALRRAHNAKAAHALAASLLAQHEFAEALEVARAVVAAAPEVTGYRALLGEIQLEMGLYGEAQRTFRDLERARGHLAVAPRLARWSEITGRTEEARAILRAARDSALARRDLPGEQVSWFHLRVADLELRNGRLAAAEAALAAGLAGAPDDPRLWAARARLEAARRRWREAIAAGERAVARTADVATLALLGDAHAARGDRARAEAYWSQAERLGIERPEPFNRAWTLFLLDHDRRLRETVSLLEREIEVRRDVYGYDQLAWARYKAGDFPGARSAMSGALRLGTRDAVVYFHAGLIELALGRAAGARDYLREALVVNPAFEPARRALESLSSTAAVPAVRDG